MNTKKLFFIFLSLFAFNVNAKEISKVFTSYETQHKASIIISPIENSGLYYIYFKGFDHRYDDNVLLYRKVRRNQVISYQIFGLSKVNVRDEKRRTLVNGTTTPYLEVFLDDGSVNRLVYTGKASTFEEKDIRKKYTERQYEAASKKDAKKIVKEAQKKFANACKRKVNVNINWSSFKSKGYEKSPVKTAVYLNTLHKICNINETYLGAVNAIHTIKVIPSKYSNEHKAKLIGRVLTLEIGEEVANLPEASYALLYDIF